MINYQLKLKKSISLVGASFQDSLRVSNTKMSVAGKILVSPNNRLDQVDFLKQNEQGEEIRGRGPVRGRAAASRIQSFCLPRTPKISSQMVFDLLDSMHGSNSTLSQSVTWIRGVGRLCKNNTLY